jgi:hypothetical protein
MTHPPADSQTPELFPSEQAAAIEQLRQRYQHLTETLTCTPALTQNKDRGEKNTDTIDPAAVSGALAAARELACAAEPLITHLPAIIAALGDAADYRGDDGWCADCTTAGSRCADHTHDQAIATAYETARHAITG